MTRASFTFEENDSPKLSAQRKEHVMSKEMVQNNVMSQITPEKIRDVESAIPLFPARQQDEEKKKSGKNETMRAQYEFHLQR